MTGESRAEARNETRDPGPEPVDDPSENLRPEELQDVRDLGSASRSCVAIIAALLILVMLLCIFLVWASVIR